MIPTVPFILSPCPLSPFSVLSSLCVLCLCLWLILIFRRWLDLELVGHGRCEFVDLCLSGINLVHPLLQFLRLAFSRHIGEPVRRVEHDYAEEPLCDQGILRVDRLQHFVALFPDRTGSHITEIHTRSEILGRELTQPHAIDTHGVVVVLQPFYS